MKKLTKIECEQALGRLSRTLSPSSEYKFYTETSVPFNDDIKTMSKLMYEHFEETQLIAKFCDETQLKYFCTKCYKIVPRSLDALFCPYCGRKIKSIKREIK